MTFEQKIEIIKLVVFTTIVITLLLTDCFLGAGLLTAVMVLHYL